MLDADAERKILRRRSVVEQQMSDAGFHELLPLGEDDAPYRKLTGDYVSTASFEGEPIVKIAPEALTLLARQAFVDCQHLLRPGHLAQLRAILNDPGASANDKFVALDLLKNANIAAGKVLPMCQDTGTAIVMAKKGQQVWTGADDAAAISEGIRRTYTETNLRYSQVAPLSMYEEVNTGDNLPAQIDIYAEPGEEYDFLFIAKGGGSANKSFLYQQSKAVLNPKSLLKFIDEKIRTLGTAACPPYHLAIVIGGTSAEMNLKTVKLASCRYLDALPAAGNKYGQAYRDRDFEAEVLELTRGLGIGAQFCGKYFCHDVRVIRLPRHGASLPIGSGVSCAADRQILGKITAHGVFVEQLETNPPPAWTAMSIRSWRQAAAASRWPRATAGPRCGKRVGSMAGSISARSAARQRASLRTASGRSSFLNIPNSAWRRSGASRSSIFPPSSWSTTRGMIFSRRCKGRAGRRCLRTV